ncbi:MAG: ATP-binding protein [Firmicutes bacterium]|nr:ATP-binding protein [Bacillota bacterium]
MTRPVNLYLLSRIPGEQSFNNIYRHTARTAAHPKTPSHEIESLRSLADQLTAEGVTAAEMDGFFFSYSIPQIGKEFDLLRFGGGVCLSIELKSQPVPLTQIRSQLLRNRHYLAHLGMEMQLFTFVSETRQCYQLTGGDVLAAVSAADIAKAVRGSCGAFLTEIDGLFRPSEYIVSPARTPEKFLAREYFLTQAQEQIQTALLSALNDTVGLAWFSLTGKPGSGKTLLLYDIGRELSSQARTAILHWGEADDGLQIINDAGIGLSVLSRDVLDQGEAAAGAGLAGSICASLAPYSYVLVDESHRLSPQQFQTIYQTAAEYHQRVVFCLDPEQILTTEERKHDIAGLVASLPPTEHFVLSEHLRGNRQLHAFIQNVRDLKNPSSGPMDYPDVDLGYAATIEEARRQLAYYRAEGYVFINYYRDALSNVSGIPADNPFAEYEGGYDIHHVIGQEFDRVVMLLDHSFYYTEDGKLEGVPRPDPDILYPNLFYQGITRVQEKLALIVLGNEPLFDQIAAILQP